ncbi:hypothetical protein PAERUG_P45_London_17_VIM_2_12_12_01289 [Pseudomonas aeruginosa]|nr:hypothetical protein PAERUG_P45_London_17_VIM_2_12_12_01289 [Pseudomonas aeruginosa]
MCIRDSLRYLAAATVAQGRRVRQARLLHQHRGWSRIAARRANRCRCDLGGGTQVDGAGILEQRARRFAGGTAQQLDGTVTAMADALQAGGIADDARAQEDHQVALHPGLAGRAEQPADAGDVAQQRYPRIAAQQVVLDQSAEDDDLAVVGQYGALDRALVGHQVHRLRRQGGGWRDGGYFLLDLQAQHAVLADVRRDLEGHPDILALDSGERIARTAGAGGVAAGLERHVLADQDFRLLVVQGQQARRRQQVAAAIAAQRGDQRAEIATAEADYRTVGQLCRRLAGLQRAQQGADGQPAVGEASAAGDMPATQRPLHPEGVADLAGQLDDRRLHQQLRARHVELADDVLEQADILRVGEDHQGIQRFVGAHQQAALAASPAILAPLAVQRFADLPEGGGKGLGVAMAQADHPAVRRPRRGDVERLRQPQQARSRLRRTEQDQAVAAAVGKDLDGGGALPGGRGDAAIEHLGDFRDPGMAHVVDAVVMFAGPVEAAHDRLDALDVGAAVADDQRVGRRYGGQMAMGRDQRPDHRDQFRHRGLLRLDHPRLQAARPIADGLLRGVLACLHVRHDTRLVALRQHRVAVGGEHRKE